MSGAVPRQRPHRRPGARRARGLGLLFALALSACAGALAACGSPEAAPQPVAPTRGDLVAVVDEALGADDPVIRAEALRLLPLAGVPELRERLRAGLSDPDARVRAAAVEASFRAGLTGPGELLLQRLGSGTQEERSESLALIVRLGPRTLVRRALEVLSLQSAVLRSEAFERLRQRRLRWSREEIPADYLQRLIEDDRPFLPLVIEALVATGHLDALDGVHADLMTAEREPRLRALRVLAAAPSPDAWPQLRWLHQHGTPEDRNLAAMALARLGDPAVHDELVDIVDARHSPQRLVAARALRHIVVPEDRPMLRRLAANDSADIRRAALDGLAALGFTAEDVLPFVQERDVDVYAALVEHLLRADSGPGMLLCTQLRVASDPMPLLRLLYAVRLAAGDPRGFAECPDILAELSGSREDEVAGLSARLRHALVGVDTTLAGAAGGGSNAGNTASGSTSGVFDRSEVLYAYLEASLVQEPAAFIGLYRESLRHELLPVRLVASLGLLRSGIQAQE